MMAAVEFGHHELARWLLGQGADANARADDRSGQTALHSAAWNGDLEMIRLLVDAGADLRARDAQYDNTPQGWAETAATVTNNPKCGEAAMWLAQRSPRDAAPL
jgi:ankyrin repeat protein